MKNLFVFIFLLLLFQTGNGQKNEILMLAGKVPYGEDVLQCNYERGFTKKFAVQVGFRYHNEVVPEEYAVQVDDGPFNTSKYIQQTFTSKKLDISPVFIPINKPRIKLKTGLGFDIGYSLYSWAFESVYRTYETEDGWIEDRYFKYETEYLVDFGIHYFILTSYYLKNNVFFSLQSMYNQVFNEGYSVAIRRRSGISFSLGIGYQF